MKNLMKKIFAPLAVLALAVGVSISVNNQKDVVGAKAEEVLYYSTSFDSTDGFTTSTTYNQPRKNQGISPYLWDFLNGTVSTTSAVTSPSAHLRGYAGAQTPRLETVFAVPNITKVVFAYKSDTNISVDLSYSTDNRATWSTSTNFARASSNTTVTYLINSAGLPGNANIRWQMNNSGTSTGAKAELAIDDVLIYYNVGTVVNPTGVSIDGDSSISVVEGSTYQLTATVSPEDATNKTVIWTSSDESKATVDSYGLVTTIAPSLTPITITATTQVGDHTDSISLTITSDPFALVGNYNFSEIGNPSWPDSTGFGAYFTTGYGVIKATSGGSIKAPLLLENVTVGSQIKVRIASVTNHASNTTNVTVHGISYSGDRISGITGSYTNPNNGGASTLESLTTRAIENRGEIILNVTTMVKIYGLEIVFESSSSRSLLSEIEVRRALASDNDQATAFANLVNSDVGASAKGSCSTILATLQNDYSLLSSGAKSIFDSSTDAKYVNARARLDYLRAWTAANPEPGAPGSVISPNNENAPLNATLIIGLLGLTTIAGYYFLSKKEKLVK